MYILCGSQGSGSAAVEVSLDGTGAPFRVVRAASWEPDSAIEGLARLNPLKQISTLLPDGSVLTERAAILVHLGYSFPAARILPTSPSARAQAMRGPVYIAANCYSAVSVIDFSERWIDDPTDAADTWPHLREHRPRFLATLERIEQHPAVAPVFACHWRR